MPHRLRAIVFDVDAASLLSIREALPEWVVQTVNGATAASLMHSWDPGAADLLVVKARADVAETLGLCRFLVSCGAYSTDSRKELTGTSEPGRSRPDQPPRADALLLVLVPPGQQFLVSAALQAGAASCLILPVHAKEVARILARARAGHRPGRHTLDLDQAQREDRWRDDGGQG